MSTLDTLKGVTSATSLRRIIDEGIRDAGVRYNVCEISACKLAEEYKRLRDAQRKAELGKSARLNAFATAARAEYKTSLSEHVSLLCDYGTLVEKVMINYEELSVIDSKNADKIMKEAYRFESKHELLREKLDKLVAEVPDVAANLEKQVNAREGMHAPAPQMTEAPAYKVYPNQPPQFYYVPQPQYYPTAPDVTPIVEKAVNEAVERITATVIAGMSEHNQEVRSVDGRSVSVAEKLIEEEDYVINKLTALMGGIEALLGRLGELGEAFVDISAKQEQTVELQKKINDMQRALARELQGVQVNQKLINQEQVELLGEQSVLIETQKAAAENQKALTEAQANLADIQKVVIETHGAIEESMREVLSSQKEMLTAQGQIMATGMKNIEKQKELSEKQKEMTLLQKAMLSEHKKLVRSQRYAADKGSQAKSESEDSLGASVSEEVELEELAVTE